ncbi:MAG: 2,3-bisphosphoglycerate-dependent phosphoglycerate mutase [Candidatus Kapabacteria bacterium]|nr:2,3-bisphosphoglycerate-dependent phosphoglycerate mutase [Candidatus Kapabacteria bacterium]
MPKLILVRHGQSQWNLENRFTGWVDIELTPLGIEEAQNAGKLLKGISIDVLFTSVLIRAKSTAEIILKEMGITEIETHRDQALNERHYGDLQGLNKDDIGKQYGLEQLHIWRRSYDIPPPNGESLKDTQARVMPYYYSTIEPMLKAGKDVLVVAHGNSLRSMLMHLENISKDKITELNIPTGTPYLIELDENLNIKSTCYLESGN